MFAGYCALAEGKPPRLQELVLPDAALLPAFAAALAQHTGVAGVRVQLYPWQRAELAYFASVAEQGVCVPNHSYRVSIGRLRPAPQWRCSALMTIRRF